MKKKVPNPGSDEAIKRGCVCPIIDNGHGYDDHGGYGFWITVGCPLHCPLPKKKKGKK